MLARCLRVLLLLEGLVYFAAGTVAVARGSLGTTLAAIAAIALSLRAFPVLTGFVVAWFARAERPRNVRLGVLGTLRLLGQELLTVCVLYTVLLPFERRFTVGAAGAMRGVPVLLIHGFFENSGLWWPLARALRGRGFEFDAVTLEPLFGSIDGYVAAISERVQQLSAGSPTGRVVLIGHSMGGLVARAALQRDPSAATRVAGLITLGTPHHGTVLARLANFANVLQMRRDSQWLSDLNASPPPEGIGVRAIYSWHDNIVAPQDGATLEHAHNIPVTGIGHQALVLSTAVQELVYESLSSTAAGGTQPETGSPP